MDTQQWYNLSDPGTEEALYDIQSMRAFAGLELGRDAIPDETTILNFRHLLERHELTKAIFAAVAEHLKLMRVLTDRGSEYNPREQATECAVNLMARRHGPLFESLTYDKAQGRSRYEATSCGPHQGP